MLIDIGKLFRHIHVAIQVNIAVGGMIIGSVEIQELLIGQLRNHIRIPAGLHAVGGVRVQRITDLPHQHIVGGGKSSLHLIVHDPV